MLKRSCEDKDTMYLCLPFVRLIFFKRKYMGWYKPRH